MKLKYKEYLHSSKSCNVDRAEELGFEDNDKAMNNFLYSLYEIELDMEVDTETGESQILGVNGAKLENSVKSSI